MIPYHVILEAHNTLIEYWGESGKRVVEACLRAIPFNDSFTSFLSYCTACGGNWGGMLLTGIRKLFPEVYDAIPENMGCQAFGCLCSVLVLCGVDTSK